MKITKKVKETKKCWGCGRLPVFSIHSMFCKRCSRVAFRMKARRFSPEAEEGVWKYIRTYGFVCFYTGMPLDMTDFNSPWYGVFDSVTPGDRSRIVLTSALFNEMKSDLSIKEFWYYIRQLANFKRNHTKIRKKKLVYWYRLSLRVLKLKSLRD